jgi:short-subunit dehydrogenase involved in D-alanine esterification of teichoic acids
MKLRNDKILVFGGGSGIGKAIAKRFCDAGAKVLITGINEEKLKKTAASTSSLLMFQRKI